MRVIHTIFIMLLAIAGYSQTYKLKRYAEQDGLKNRFIYTIDQDSYGALWIGTGDGLFRFDGFQFKEFKEEDGLAQNFITCSFGDANGNVWFGHNNGKITSLQKNILVKYDLTSFTNSKINQIKTDENGNILVLSQNDGLYRLGANNNWTQIKSGLEDLTLYDFHMEKNGTIWLGTDLGLLRGKIKNDNSFSYEFTDSIIETKVTCIEAFTDHILVSTDDSGIYRIDLKGSAFDVKAITLNQNSLNRHQINSIYTDSDKNLWISTNNNGLIQLFASDGYNYTKSITYSDEAILKTRSIRLCKKDREGNLWIGSTGSGLVKILDDYFSIFQISSEDDDRQVYSICEKNDTIWSGGNGVIHISHEHPDKRIGILNSNNGLPNCPVTAIYIDSQKNIWAGTRCGGLYRMPYQSSKFIHVELEAQIMDQKINDIIGLNDLLYVATDFGIYQLVKEKVVSHMSIQSGLPHNIIKSLYRDSKGRIWLGTMNNQITYIENGAIQSINSPFRDALVEFTAITEDNFGHIWIGTDGSGLIQIAGDQVTTYSKNSGLYSDYCYSIICDNKNQLWVGHHGAMSQVNLKNGQIKIFDPSNSSEIKFSNNAVDKFPNGNLLFGTDHGIVRYEPDKDLLNTNEPIVIINQISFSDSVYDFNPRFDLSSGTYNLRIDFMAISLRNPENVTYKYMLEGYDSDWSEPKKNRFVEYNKLPYGSYTFKIMAFNSDGIGGTQVVGFEVNIDKPFYLKFWFIASCILSTALFIRYIILRRERFLKANQEYLKKELGERTREVVEQKELLEVKNKDITDSIVYAKNIQKAMLPAPSTLNNYFPDAFVIYKPRDIVSGDFYSVERVNNTIVVALADCTGHGVPGAFMSLIGTTLIKEVASDKDVQSSSAVLYRLDEELREMLNKQGDSYAVEDGMDISVMDYNIQTRKLRIASANRPVIVFHNNTWHDIKGDRTSIGGSSRTDHKVFTEHEFMMSPGDMVFMYSDGITDQFGGASGKKLKRSGLNKWIQETTSITMLEQRQKIKSNFDQWKGPHPQIDDIIMLGIRF